MFTRGLFSLQTLQMTLLMSSLVSVLSIVGYKSFPAGHLYIAPRTKQLSYWHGLYLK